MLTVAPIHVNMHLLRAIKPTEIGDNSMNVLAYIVMRITGYRFPKEGLFGRGTDSREVLMWLGINPVFLNLKFPE